jgi:radical SAM protein with 4Fe4S-binding SPASM domain
MDDVPGESVKILERDNQFLLFDPSIPRWKKISSITALLLIIAQKGDDFIDHLEPYSDYSSKMLKSLLDSAISAFKKEITQGKIGHPLDIEFNMTDSCPGKCIYCYYTYSCDHLLTPDEWKSILESVIDLHPDRIIFSGGDPLYYEGLIDVANYAQELSLQTHLLSNGLIPKDITSDIAASMDSVQISIDGFEHTQQYLRGISFHEIMTSIRHLLDHGVSVSAGITLTSLNIHEVVPLIEYLSRVGVDAFHISLLKEIGKGKGEPHLRAPADAIVNLFLNLFESDIYVDTLHHLLPKKARKKYNCGVGKEILSIMPDGYVYPCDALIKPEFSCGSALKTDLKDIYWNSSALHTLRGLTVDQMQPCNTCEYKYVCGGGCIGETLAHCNTIGVFQPTCEFLKKFYEEFIWIT